MKQPGADGNLTAEAGQILGLLDGLSVEEFDGDARHLGEAASNTAPLAP